MDATNSPTPSGGHDAMLLEGVAGRLAEAEAAGVPRVELLGVRGVVRQATERVQETAQYVARVNADDNLSEKGKQERTRELLDLTRSLVEEAVSDVRERIDAVISRAQNAGVTPPVDDPMLLEQKLMGARHDAELRLSSADDVGAALRDLATNGDPVGRYLVLMTPWPTAYLQSRDAGPMVTQSWPKTQASLRLEAAHGPEMAAALKRLGQVPVVFESFARKHYPRNGSLGVNFGEVRR